MKNGKYFFSFFIMNVVTKKIPICTFGKKKKKHPLFQFLNFLSVIVFHK